MIKKVIVSLFAAAIFSASTAGGIQYITYNSNKIPNIITAAGVASEIIFEDDEVIEYSTFGFDAAWESQKVRDHILVFKAKDMQPETNLIVHTNKRDYLFTVTTGNNDWEKHPDRSGAVYSVRMVYRDAKSKAAQQEEKSATLRNREIATQFSYVYTNYDYRATENANNIIPYRVWDNGTLTFIAFKDGAKRGVVYELDDERKPHLVNQHTEKNGVLVVHGVYPQLIVRLGDQAVELRRNEQYGHRENLSKTNVENTTRFTASDAPTKFKKPAPDPVTPIPIGEVFAPANKNADEAFTDETFISE